MFCNRGYRLGKYLLSSQHQVGLSWRMDWCHDRELLMSMDVISGCLTLMTCHDSGETWWSDTSPLWGRNIASHHNTYINLMFLADETTSEFLLQSVSCLSSVIPQVSTYRIRFQTVLTDMSRIKDFLPSIHSHLLKVMESDSILD